MKQKTINQLLYYRISSNKIDIQMSTKTKTNYQYDDVIVLRLNSKDKAHLEREAFKRGRKLSQHLREVLLK